MIHDRVMIAVPEVKIVQLEDVPELLGAPEEIVSATVMKLLGDVTGRTVQIFPRQAASALVGALTGRRAVGFPMISERSSSPHSKK
jgi:chemotaxis protein CheC